MGQNLSETVKGKLSVGAKIIKNGGRENIFRQVFGKGEEEENREKLLKASQCYLSTTAGPIAGILFISTHKVAFCSERPITLPCSPSGILLRTPYKVFFFFLPFSSSSFSLNALQLFRFFLKKILYDKKKNTIIFLNKKIEKRKEVGYGNIYIY